MRQRLSEAGVVTAWSSASGRSAIGIHGTGLALLTPEGEQIESWRNVSGWKLVGRDKIELNFAASDGWTGFQFAAPSHRDRFFQAMPDEDRARLTRDSSQRSREHVAGQRQTSQAVAPESDAVTSIWKLLWAGVALQFLGGFIIGSASLSLEREAILGALEFGSNDMAAMLGWALIGAGTLAALAAVIAFGVRLGIRAARDSS